MNNAAAVLNDKVNINDAQPYKERWLVCFTSNILYMQNIATTHLSQTFIFQYKYSPVTITYERHFSSPCDTLDNNALSNYFLFQ